MNRTEDRHRQTRTLKIQFMQISLARKILAGFIICVVILTAATFLSLRNSDHFSNKQQIACRQLPSATVADAEDAVSRFIVPGNDSCERPSQRIVSIPINQLRT